jgi:hypothetical protein
VLWHVGDEALFRMRGLSLEGDEKERSYEDGGKPHDVEAGPPLPSGRRTLPTVEFKGTFKEELPPEAARLMAKGMCTVFAHFDLWPRAMRRWGAREYLGSNLGNLDCEVRTCERVHKQGSRTHQPRLPPTPPTPLSTPHAAAVRVSTRCHGRTDGRTDAAEHALV